MKKVSVIIPVYNVEKYLDRCVESVVNQTYKNLEIILVDDGSPDNCPQICDEWAKKDSRIKVIHKKNGGPSEARNAGLEKSSGNYIAFVDSDDYLDLDCYEKAILNNDCDLVVFGLKLLYNKNIQYHCMNDNEYLNNNLEFFNESFVAHCFNSPCNKLYKRSVIEDIRFDPDFKYGEDYKFNMQILNNASKIRSLKYCSYNYIMESNLNSVTKLEANNKKLESFVMQIKMAENLNCPLDNFVAYEFLDLIFDMVRKCAKNKKIARKDKINFIKMVKSNEQFRNVIKNAKPKSLKQRIVKLIMKQNAHLMYYICKSV